MKLIKTKTASSFLFKLIFSSERKIGLLLFAPSAARHFKHNLQALFAYRRKLFTHWFLEKQEKTMALRFSANPLFFLNASSRAPPLFETSVFLLRCWVCAPSRTTPHSSSVYSICSVLYTKLGKLPALQDAHGSACTEVALELFLDIWTKDTN